MKSSASMWFSEDSGGRGSRGKRTDTHTRRYIDTYIHTETIIPTMQCVFRFNCEYFTQTESLLKCSLQTCLTERNCPWKKVLLNFLGGIHYPETLQNRQQLCVNFAFFCMLPLKIVGGCKCQKTIVQHNWRRTFIL